MEPDCTAPANIEEWNYCNVEAVTAPVVEAVGLLTGTAVLLAVILAGVLFVRRLVREFGDA